MPSPIKVVNLGISPATHIICEVTRISARCLIWVVRAVIIDEITPLFQVNTRTIWTLEARWRSWCGRGRWETWRWKKKVSQERFNKFICTKNLDFKKNILSAPSSSFWVHIFGTIDRWLLKVFIGRVSQGKKQVLISQSPLLLMNRYKQGLSEELPDMKVNTLQTNFHVQRLTGPDEVILA